MTTIGLVKDPHTIHQLLFALPVLRYCNTTFKWDNDNFSLLDFIDKSSTIEHFVSKSTYDLQNFNILLSYMPRLVRLSYHGALLWKYSQLWRPITLANLTYFHVHSSISFNEFEILMLNVFHQLQVLRISSAGDNDYLDSNRWERLISTHMPRLHTFHFQHFVETLPHDSYHLLIDGFTSRFWIEHQWFFAHKYYQYNKTFWVFFYSINSNRYTSNLTNGTCSFEKINLDFTRHIVISNDSTTIDLCSAQLTVSCTDHQNKDLLVDELNCIIPLEQLTNLIVASNKFYTNQVMELLCFCSNIHILTIPEYSSSLLSLPNENNNKLQQLFIREKISLKDVQELINALPRLKSLEIKIRENDLELIVRYLLKHINNNKKHHLCLLGFRDAHSVMVKRLQKVIDREELVQTYSIEYIADTAYLWW